MADIKIIASPDFEEQKASLTTLFGSAILSIRPKGKWASEQIDLKLQLDSVGIQTEEDIRKLSGAAGWGLVGTLALGPAGLILGALWGGRKHKEICFAALLKDGRKFLGVTEPHAFRKLQAITFK